MDYPLIELKVMQRYSTVTEVLTIYKTYANMYIMLNPEKQTLQSDNLEMVLASPAGEADSNPGTTDFEKNLFSDGVYIYDPIAEHANAEHDIAVSAEWYKSNPGWDERRTRDSLSRNIFQKRWELAWKQRFSGQIPKDWETWHAPGDDIEEAENNGLQLSSILLDAAVSHDHHLVANKAGTLQDLNTHQLAIAFARELPPWNIGQIIEAQVKRGMSEGQIAEARRMAEEIRKRMSYETIQMDSGNPETAYPATKNRTFKGLLKGIVGRG